MILGHLHEQDPTTPSNHRALCLEIIVISFPPSAEAEKMYVHMYVCMYVLAHLCTLYVYGEREGEGERERA